MLNQPKLWNINALVQQQLWGSRGLREAQSSDFPPTS
jgi:hypothetical protein